MTVPCVQAVISDFLLCAVSVVLLCMSHITVLILYQTEPKTAISECSSKLPHTVTLHLTCLTVAAPSPNNYGEIGKCFITWSSFFSLW
jgi:hypothetical protein